MTTSTPTTPWRAEPGWYLGIAVACGVAFGLGGGVVAGLLAAAGMASAYRDAPLAEHYRARCKATIRSLADSITDDKLRRQFLKSEPIQAALT